MLSQIARSFLTRVSAKGLLFLVLPCDLPPWVLCTSLRYTSYTSSSFYTVTVLCLFLLLFVPFPISFSTSFLLFVVYHFYLSLFSVMSPSPFRSLFFLSRVLFHFLHLHILCSFTILPFLLVSFVLLGVTLSSLCSHLHGPLGYFVIFASLLSARFPSSLRADVPLHERTGIFCLPRSLSVL